MRVVGIQTDLMWEDHETNRRRFAERLWAAAGTGASLVVLPEMFPTGFSMNADHIAEDPEGTTVQWMIDQAATHNVFLAGSLAVAGDDRPFNRLVVTGPDGLLGHYDKRHPFSYGGEHTVYASGDDHLTVTVNGVRTTFFICYDLRFADEFWATAGDTELYVVVANWPRARRAHWTALLTARAIENQAYVIGVNRIGRDGNDLDYAGDSMIIDPLGNVLSSASDTESLVNADITADRVHEIRTQFPFFNDRRPVQPSNK